MRKIEHTELQPPKVFDAITFLIQFGPLNRDHPDERSLKDHIRATVQNYLDKNGLADKVSLLVAERDVEAMPPAEVFGADFRPDMVLMQEGQPIVAILVKLVKGLNTSGITETAGRALIHSFQYPWVLALVMDKGKRHKEKRVLDHEFRADMWHNRHVRFIFR